MGHAAPFFPTFSCLAGELKTDGGSRQQPSFSAMLLDLQGVCVRCRFCQTSIDPSKWHQKTPTCILILLGKATAETLVGLIMHIMSRHFQNGHWFWEAPLQNEHPFFQIKDTRSIFKIGLRLVGSTGHQILKHPKSKPNVSLHVYKKPYHLYKW